MSMADLKFWGVRGSLAVSSSRFGSNTSCVELDLGEGFSIFFDAGSGIRAATRGRSFKKMILCLSHFHWDHIQGLPFMSQLENPEFEIEIVTGFKDAEERLAVLFDERFHPVPFEAIRGKLKIRILEPKEILKIGNLKIEIAPLHHPGLSYAFRVQTEKNSFCYATDSDFEKLELGAESLLKNVDYAVMDSQFLIGDFLKKSHYGHASFKKAIDTAARLQVQNCFLFHYDPNYSDDELETLFTQASHYSKSEYGDIGPRILMAKEGENQALIF